MSQTERMGYFMKKIGENEQLRSEIREKCDLEFDTPENLQDDLNFLLEGGCRREYKLVPFARDGAGGVAVIVDDEHIALMDSEGGAGYIAETVDDLVNILLFFGYLPLYGSIFDGYEKFLADYENDDYGYSTSGAVTAFLESEGLDIDGRNVYERLRRGVSISPEFRIEAVDEDYCDSENLFGMDEEEFGEKITPQN